MSKYLQQLLGADEPMFSTTLRQLEKMTGHKATDVAYIADMTARAHQVMRRMGLDVADTTEHELYRALAAHAHNQTLFIATDDVGIIIHGQAVSFNYEDVQENIHRPFAERMTEHMKCQIKYGLTSRYVAADGDDEVAIEELIAQAGLSVCDMSDYHEHKQTNVKQRLGRRGCYLLVTFLPTRLSNSARKSLASIKTTRVDHGLVFHSVAVRPMRKWRSSNRLAQLPMQPFLVRDLDLM